MICKKWLNIYSKLRKILINKYRKDENLLSNIYKKYQQHLPLTSYG